MVSKSKIPPEISPKEAEDRVDNNGCAVNTLQAYLHEIGSAPLLSADEEVQLAQRIARRQAELRKPETHRNYHLVEDGDRAKRRFTEANLRLVVNVAKKYTEHGMSLLDLIQEGNIGLIRAVERFDHTRGFRFSTYGVWWIRQAITQFIAEQSYLIVYPIYKVEMVKKLNYAIQELWQQFQRQPDNGEIADRMEISLQLVCELLDISQPAMSLDMPLVDGQEGVLGDLIEDTRYHRSEYRETVLTQLIKEELEQSSILTPREQRFLTLHFLQGNRLEDIAKEHGLTRERIRQIIVRACQTLAKHFAPPDEIDSPPGVLR